MLPEGALKLGVRPEYVTLAEANTPGALPVTVTQVQDVGTHFMLTAAVNGQTLKARLGSESVAPQAGAAAWLQVLGEHTCFYKNEELVP